MKTQPNRVQINCSVRTNDVGKVLERSMLINIRVDDVPTAVQLFNQLRVKLNGSPKNFNPVLAQPEESNKQIAPTNQVCTLCHEGNLVKRNGRYGEFYACTQYPSCDFTKQITN